MLHRAACCATRLGRVADRVDLLSADLQRGAADTEFLSAQLGFLRRRSLILDVAVVLATIGGAATCAAALVLVLGALRDAAPAITTDLGAEDDGEWSFAENDKTR